MAILHTFEINDPNNVGLFPPSILASSWFENYFAFMEEKMYDLTFVREMLESGVTPNRFGAYIFEDETLYQSFKSAVDLTDPVLISDFNDWCTAHNVSLVTKVYTITEIQ
jgi:hypothetical protein